MEDGARRGLRAGDAGLFAGFAKALLREGAALARPLAVQRHVLARWALLLLEGLGGLSEESLPAAPRAKAAIKLAEFLAGQLGALLLEDNRAGERAWRSLARAAGRALAAGDDTAVDALLAAAELPGPPGAGTACLLADALPSLPGGGGKRDQVLEAILKSWGAHIADVKAVGYKALAPRLGRILQNVGVPAVVEGAIPALLRLLKRSPDNALTALNAVLEGQVRAGTDLSPVVMELLEAVLPQLKHSSAGNRDESVRAASLLAARALDPAVADEASRRLIEVLSGKKEKLKNANEKCSVLGAVEGCGARAAAALSGTTAAAAVQSIMDLHAAESNEQLLAASLDALASWCRHLDSLPDSVAPGLAKALGAKTAPAVRLSALRALLHLVAVEKFRPQLVVSAAKPLGFLANETLTKGAMNTLGSSALLALERLRRSQNIPQDECDVQGLLNRAFADASPLLADGHIQRLNSDQQKHLSALLQEALLNHPEKLSETGRAAACRQLASLSMCSQREVRLAALSTIRNCVPGGGSKLVETMAHQLVQAADALRPGEEGEMHTVPADHWSKAVFLAMAPDDLASLGGGVLVELIVCAHHPLVTPASAQRARAVWGAVTARHFTSTGKRFAEVVQNSGKDMIVALVARLVGSTAEKEVKAVLASIGAVISECPEFLFPVLLNKLKEIAPLQEHKEYSKKDFQVRRPSAPWRPLPAQLPCFPAPSHPVLPHGRRSSCPYLRVRDEENNSCPNAI